MPITKPAMGISNDYGITPMPNTSDPDPQEGTEGFVAYKEAGVDSFEFQIRGGTHEESAFIPGMTVPVLGLASLRGSDLVAWYSTAWFDKQVKCADGSACEADADQRLLTDRWRHDERSGQVDTNGDPNVFSFYKLSRFDFLTSGGAEVTCDDMREGCATMRPDDLPDGYSFVSDAYSAPPVRRATVRSPPDETPPCGLAQAGPTSPTPRRPCRRRTPATQSAASAGTTSSAAARATTASSAARARTGSRATTATTSSRAAPARTG